MENQLDICGSQLVENPYDSELLAAVETYIKSIDFRENGVGVRISDCMQIPELHRVVFNGILMDCLRRILPGSPCIFPNITVRRNSQTPWHVDEAFRSNAVDWRDSELSEFVQVTTYFQVNDENGGGLEVIPKSHKLLPEIVGNRALIDVVRALLKRARTIESKPGDLVIWDGRLLHRSTPRTETCRSNYAMHWTVASDRADLSGFMKHIIARGRNTDDPFGVDRRYGEVEKFRFATDAPPEFLAAAAKEGVQLVDMSAVGEIAPLLLTQGA